MEEGRAERMSSLAENQCLGKFRRGATTGPLIEESKRGGEKRERSAPGMKEKKRIEKWMIVAIGIYRFSSVYPEKRGDIGWKRTGAPEDNGGQGRKKRKRTEAFCPKGGDSWKPL